MFSWIKRLKKESIENNSEQKNNIKYVDRLPDDELKILNNILDWASYVNDASGRAFGKAYSSNKRSTPQEIPDRRIAELNRRYPLRSLRVLEVGCFEGNHTVGLLQFCDDVVAIDSRIEHVVKTIVRTSMFGFKPDVLRLDLEQPFPVHDISKFDVLHHVGVLYHLTDPVKHLNEVLPHCRIIMLDTHIATEYDTLNSYSSDGATYRYKKFQESGRSAPFAGMKDHAKWLLVDDIVNILKQHGFDNIEIAEHRQERNGPRILLYANKPLG